MVDLVKAKANYHAQSSEELSFVKGDEFTVIEEGDEWFLVSAVHNPDKKGYIPVSHIKLATEDREDDDADTMSFSSSVYSDYDKEEELESESDEEDDRGPSLIVRRLSRLQSRRRSSLVQTDALGVVLKTLQGSKTSPLSQFWHEGLSPKVCSSPFD